MSGTRTTIFRKQPFSLSAKSGILSTKHPSSIYRIYRHLPTISGTYGVSDGGVGVGVPPCILVSLMLTKCYEELDAVVVQAASRTR